MRHSVSVRPAFLVGVGLGYVVGARAGRERYEALLRAGRELVQRPAVQTAAGVVTAKAGSLLRGRSGLD